MQPGLQSLLQILRLLAGDPQEPEDLGSAASWAHLAASRDDLDDDDVVGPPETVPRCEERLKRAAVSFEVARLPVHRSRGGGLTCGAEQVVRYATGPGQIRWKGRPKVTCGVALALARFESIVQEEAKAHLGRPVTRIHHMGTYNCREMAAYPGWVSEHSYANAIDVKAFVLRGGRVVSVLEHYDDEGSDGMFLRRVAKRAYEEDVFSVVLTPAFDRAHRNHFHLDLARYRVDGT